MINTDFIIQEKNLSQDFLNETISGKNTVVYGGGAACSWYIELLIGHGIYHNPEDIIKIPCYIKAVVPSYKMYIRHHNYGAEKTVLYCVPR